MARNLKKEKEKIERERKRFARTESNKALFIHLIKTAKEAEENLQSRGSR
jgi:hypothetical protein